MRRKLESVPRSKPAEPPRYHLVVQHQLSVEQAVSLECYTDDRDQATNDIQHFIRVFTAEHEVARARAFSQAEKVRELTAQKIANLQAEQQRLESVVAALRTERDTLTTGAATGAANGAASG